MDMWLLDRRAPLAIYGLSYTLDRVETMMQLYEWKTWKNFYPVTFHRVREAESAPVFRGQEMQMTASPMKHFIPSMGIRMDFVKSQVSVVYSADTAPNAQLVALARGANFLIHESTGASAGHSSARQAGEAAEAAGVGCLYLIHYPARETNPEQLIAEAQSAYHGPVRLAEDFGSIEIE
jgi:ribonuclease Z